MAHHMAAHLVNVFEVCGVDVHMSCQDIALRRAQVYKQLTFEYMDTYLKAMDVKCSDHLKRQLVFKSRLFMDHVFELMTNRDSRRILENMYKNIRLIHTRQGLQALKRNIHAMTWHDTNALHVCFGKGLQEFLHEVCLGAEKNMGRGDDGRLGPIHKTTTTNEKNMLCAYCKHDLGLDALLLSCACSSMLLHSKCLGDITQECPLCLSPFKKIHVDPRAPFELIHHFMRKH